MSRTADEMIMVIPRRLFDELGSFQGLSFEADRYLPVILSGRNNFFMPRSKAETDPAHKQIIPYVILVCGDKILHYTRGKKGGEQRLHAKGSVGIGGHMNEGDESLFALDAAAYLAAVEREVTEEIMIGGKFEDRIVALLNDDSNEVGQVHLGIVHVFRLDSENVSSKESAIANLGFLSVAELKARRDNLESWSQICVDALDQILSATGVKA